MRLLIIKYVQKQLMKIEHFSLSNKMSSKKLASSTIANNIHSEFP